MRRSLSVLMVLALPVSAGLTACSSSGDPSAQSSHSSSTSSSAAAPKSAPKSDPTKGDVPGTVDDSKTVAVVNGHKIKGAVFNRMLTQVHLQGVQQQRMLQAQGQAAPSPSTKKEQQQAIDTVVGTELLVQAAEAHGYTASKKSIDRQVDQVRKQYPTKKKLRQALHKNHMTMDALRTDIGDHLKIQAYVTKELGPFTVTDREVSAYYAQLKKQAKAGDGQGSIPPLKTVKPQIEQQLQSRKQQQEVRSEVSKLKKQGDVNVLI